MRKRRDDLSSCSVGTEWSIASAACSMSINPGLSRPVNSMASKIHAIAGVSSRVIRHGAWVKPRREAASARTNC